MEGSRAKRRLVQSTLFPQLKETDHCDANGGGEVELKEEDKDEEEELECCGSSKKRGDSNTKRNSRKTTTPRGSAKKVAESGKEKQVNDSDSPVTIKSNFFVKKSERQQLKGQNNQPGSIDPLEENNDICSPPSSIASGTSTPRKPKRQDSSTPKKRSRNSTPNKKIKSGTKESCCGPIPFDLNVDELPAQTIPDLRLEAKLTAEENLRIFGGRQIHPFFSSWKGGKVVQDVPNSESNRFSFGRNERGITFNPIHVFEIVEDDRTTLDWGPWIFSDRSAAGDIESGHSPVYEGSVDSLTFDNIFNISHFTRTLSLQNSNQCPVPQKEVPTELYDQPEASVELYNQPKCSHALSSLQLANNRRIICSQQQQGSEMLPKATEDIFSPSVESLLLDHKLVKNEFTAGSSCSCNLDSELQKKLLEERIMSHYHTCHNQPENCLWTDKYQPQNAKQICGNGESVKLLSEWLHHWHKRGPLTSRSCTKEDKFIMQDIDIDYQQSDSDSDSIDGEESLKNVLLVMGPVGSGKSAAIYACAKDQGFQIIEINASDWRNGALVKQKFGEAVESHWLQRTGENSTNTDKSLLKVFKAVNSENHCFGEEAIELIDFSNMEDSQDASAWPSISNSLGSKPANHQNEIKTLILFEDVDATLCEDHGFITTIQQLAETAKRPMILTSNSDNPILPKNLDRLELSFSVPSAAELLGLVHMICAAEKAIINPCLVERFVDYCQGDMRKTIMFLQFWCQGQTLGRGNKLHARYWPVPFDLDAGHLILPKVLNWSYPSRLSELVAEEVIKSLVMKEETHELMETNQVEDLIDPIEVKKQAMLSLHGAHRDAVECAELETNYELSDFSYSPVALAKQNSRRKINMVLSSDSDDEFKDGCTPVSAGQQDINAELLDTNIMSISYCLSTEVQPVYHSEINNMEEGSQLPERFAFSPIDETCQSFDDSVVPESSFVPETQIFDETELYSTTVSYGHFGSAVGTAILDQDLPAPETFVGAQSTNSLHILQNKKERLGNDSDSSRTAVYKEEIGDSISKSGPDVPRGYQLLDECSRVDFMRRLKSLDSPEADQMIDFVQETWKKLHDQCIDLKKYVTAEEKTARQVLKYAHGMSNLVSEADLLLKDCQTLMLDSLGLSMIPTKETHSYGYCNDQLEMSSVLAQHGLCYYAKETVSLGSTSSLDLASEMLSSSGSSLALGKLASQDQKMGVGSDTERTKSDNLLTSSKLDSGLCNLLKTVVPAKSYLAAKGGAFHEYISTLSQISRFEASRLSECIDIRKQRRARVSRHYLSSGSSAMSSEEISLLGRFNCYRKTSS